MTNNQVISIFPRWGHFPSKFQNPLAAKLLIGSKKVKGCKNGTNFLYHRAKYGGDRGSRAGCRQKSMMFFVWLSICFLSCFGMTKFVITETLWSSLIFRTILMVSLHTGRFVVVHLYSTFSVDPQNFPLGVNLYKKLRFFAFFWGCRPTFLKREQWNFVWGCGPGTPSPSQILYKKSPKAVYPFGQIRCGPGLPTPNRIL